MREVFYILIIRAFVKGFIVSHSQSRRQQINPSIGAERIMASVRLWPKFLQREGLSLHVAAIAFPPKATARKQDAEREFKHLYNWMKTAVCNEPATLIALPTDEPANPNTAQIYRAVIGIPLGKLTTAKLTEHLQGYNAKQKDASFSVRPITTYDKDDLSRALSKLGRLKRREHFVLSEDGLRWSEDGLPIICSGREIMPAPSLLQLQAGFRALLRDHGAALRRGESLTCLSLGLFPTVSLIITPTTDLVERVLSGEFKGNESRDASGGRLITKDVLRQATLCIPSLGAETTCFGDADFVFEDLCRIIGLMLSRVEEQSQAALSVDRWLLSPLHYPWCGTILYNRPKWMGMIVGLDSDDKTLRDLD